MPDKRKYRYARVIIDPDVLEVEKFYEYYLPDELIDRLAVGNKVLVPFGRRFLEAYVAEMMEGAGKGETKGILKVLDSNSYFNEEAVKLAVWMASFYFCSLSRAFRCVLPGAVRPRLKKYLVLSPKAVEGFKKVFNDHQGKKTIEIQVLEFIFKRGMVTERTLKRSFSGWDIKGVLSSLRKKNLVEVVQKEKGLFRKERKKRVVLSWETKKVVEYVRSMENRAPRQILILKYLLEEGEADLAILKKQTGASVKSIKSLGEKGIITFKETPFTAAERSAAYPECCTEIRHILSVEQKNCWQDIRKAMAGGKRDIFLLHGVTGSGKTEIYLKACENACKTGRGAVMLVPEISLATQLIDLFRARLGERAVVLLHSRLGGKNQLEAWQKIKKGEAKVVVGTRSAVFAPLQKIGVFILDEEHENTYQQDSLPKYHAREVALQRAYFHKAAVILGSATPSLESYYRAKKGEYNLLRLNKRVENRPLPDVKIVDLRRELKRGNRSVFSRLLQERISERLKNKEQVLLFLNKRGYAGFVICRDCGYVPSCPHCSVSFSHHVQGKPLRCHYCGCGSLLPKYCPRCGSKRIRGFGLGTERVEEELRELFPGARIIRMDADSTTKSGMHERLLKDFSREKADILVGTQMIAKGLDFHNVTLVGVISADITLHLPDFRAGERAFQLITQVAGRAGRGKRKGEVVIQTYNPGEKSIVAAEKQDYESFYEKEIQLREKLQYPPFVRLVRVLCTGFNEGELVSFLGDLRRQMEEALEGIENKYFLKMIGPAPSTPVKIKDRYRWHLIIRGKDLKLIREVLRSSPFFQAGLQEGKASRKKYSLSVDIDPQGLL